MHTKDSYLRLTYFEFWKAEGYEREINVAVLGLRPRV